MAEVQRNLYKADVCFSCGDRAYNRDHMLPQVMKGSSAVRAILPNHPFKRTIDGKDNQFSVCRKEHNIWDMIKVDVFQGVLGCGLRLCERFGGENIDCKFERFCIRDPNSVKDGESPYWRYIFEDMHPFSYGSVHEEPGPIRICNTNTSDYVEIARMEQESAILQKLDGEPAYLMWYLSEKYPTPIFARHYDPYVGAVTRTLERYRQGVASLTDQLSPGLTAKYRDSLVYVGEFERKVANLKRPPLIFDMMVPIVTSNSIIAAEQLIVI